VHSTDKCFVARLCLATSQRFALRICFVAWLRLATSQRFALRICFVAWLRLATSQRFVLLCFAPRVLVRRTHPRYIREATRANAWVLRKSNQPIKCEGF
jgi:hypothetical protein